MRSITWAAVVTRPTTGSGKYLSLTAVLEKVREIGPRVTARQLAVELGEREVERTVVEPALAALAQKGYVRREGDNFYLCG